jgi:DNA (cytosine-5)-methyltransferase 1
VSGVAARPTSVELFAGGGGMALGTRLAGFTHTALVEWNKNAARILRHNAELHPDLWRPEDIYEKDVRLWLRDYHGSATVDLVAGGPPCQPFSLAGVHAGNSDERNMFPVALDVVRELTPRFVIFENVPGLTRPSFAPYYEYVKAQLAKPTVRPDYNEMWAEHYQRVITARPRKIRYMVYEERIEAADLGLPQNRRRVFLIGIRADVPGAHTWSGVTRACSQDALLYDQWVDTAYWAQHGLPQPPLPDKLQIRIHALKRAGRPVEERWRTLRDGIKGLPGPIDGVENDTVAQHVGIPGARAYRKHTGSPIDWPSKTIKAGVHGVCGGEAMIRFPDQTLRYLTIREAARLQGFPDDYEFPGARSRVMGAIGNAVAVPIADIIARSLLDHCGLTQPSAPNATPSPQVGLSAEPLFSHGTPSRSPTETNSNCSRSRSRGLGRRAHVLSSPPS